MSALALLRGAAPAAPPAALSPAEASAIAAAAAAVLPPHYNFEVAKTVLKVRASGARRVGLQLPEGLLLFACALADLVAHFTGADCVVLGDVTYGACCVDDLGAAALGVELLVHYGHSCLVPIDLTAGGPFARGAGSAAGGAPRPPLRVLYVFVDVAFDTAHLVATVKANFPRSARLALLGTIQFAPALYELKAAMDAEAEAEAAAAAAAAGGGENDAAACGGGTVLVPQAKPLSPGEVLGCTSPRLGAELRLDAFVFVADGRFHLESVMIHNPGLPAFRYDPYAKAMTRERYDTPAMLAARRAAVARASRAASFGLILGTLGRQGSTALLERLEAKLEAAGRSHFTLLLSEISPAKLARFGADVECWVQVACPRLSIDWGEGFGGVPLLTPYECEVALGTTEVRPRRARLRAAACARALTLPLRPARPAVARGVPHGLLRARLGLLDQLLLGAARARSKGPLTLWATSAL